MTEEFNVGVVGTGYVGLVTGVCLAHIGHRVVCMDKDRGRLSELEEGRVPIHEPGLEELVTEGLHRGRLRFTSELAEVVHEADVVFIAVDTPQREDGSTDLSSVGAVAWGVGRALAELEPKPGAERMHRWIQPVSATLWGFRCCPDRRCVGGEAGSSRRVVRGA